MDLHGSYREVIAAFWGGKSRYPLCFMQTYIQKVWKERQYRAIGKLW